MHAVVATVGTDGDVFPYLALATALKSRGHRVTFVCSSGYEKEARHRGLEFRSLVDQTELTAWFRDPDFWHPTRHALVAARWGTSSIEAQYEVMRTFAEDEQAVMITSPAVMGARLVQERFERPLINVILQPWLIPSNIVPPLLPVVSLPPGLPAFMGDAFWWVVDLVGDRLVGVPLNKVRRKLGLKPIRKALRWWFSPQRIIGLFPDWYGPPQTDWPRQIRLTGFVTDDGRTHATLPEDLRRECLESPPLVFTFGTEMQAAAMLFAAGIEACRLLNRRALILTKYPHQLLQPLPDHVRHIEYAPFSQLFPLCAAVVHHGGIGTTARCLQAGAPQLIAPFAFDQRDNAARVQRLGVGGALPRGRWTARDLAAALEPLLQPEVKQRCETLREKANLDGTTVAVEHIEQLAKAFTGGWRSD
ncbi:MAG TPA: nucleotide disphospho-sugar-binding domain-containing protein [Planctomycetaceae bacterium]|nr:nucleotide disphospho-sugar-binding domain-containing protein [Planctomycetaceae bacterium]